MTPKTQVKAAVAGIQLPADVTWSFTGQSEQQTDGFASLILAMALSILFVYMVLASQFGSFSQPIVIMTGHAVQLHRRLPWFRF
jgi:HAE1 family hydrophobic/amphiphilic exporter-1